MLPFILFLVLSGGSLVWTLYRKLHRQMLLPRGDRHYRDVLTIALPAVATLINAVLVYRLSAVDSSVVEHIIQMLACCTIVPLVYMHFARQVGRQVSNGTTVVLWLLFVMVLVPEVVIYNPFVPYEPLHFMAEPFTIYVVSHGEMLWNIYTGDLIVMIQALVTILRVVPLMRSLREKGLRFSRSVYSFFVWWIVTAIYILMVSSLTEAQITSVIGMWFYYAGMTFCMVSINTLFALDFDLHPVETEQGEVVEDIDMYMDRLYVDLARQMEEVMNGELLFRQPGYTVEDMCERLHTNRKLLSQMMQRQFGVHFPEYLNNRRLEYAQHLLLTTEMKMDIVAEESGFAGRSHMIRLFKQHYDCTPTQWLKEQHER